jgi:hypothetical protein
VKPRPTSSGREARRDRCLRQCSRPSTSVPLRRPLRRTETDPGTMASVPRRQCPRSTAFVPMTFVGTAAELAAVRMGFRRVKSTEAYGSGAGREDPTADAPRQHPSARPCGRAVRAAFADIYLTRFPRCRRQPTGFNADQSQRNLLNSCPCCSKDARGREGRDSKRPSRLSSTQSTPRHRLR